VMNSRRRMSFASQMTTVYHIGSQLLCITADREARLPPWVLCHEHRRSTRRCATVREMKEVPSSSAIRC
jgi:hypothetical protein